jgi:hypothetical protein
MPFKMRPFTKEDWYGFAGSMEAEGKPPMIREGQDWLGVSDLVQVEVHYDSEEITESYVFATSNYEMAKLILEALPDSVRPHQLVDLGFQRYFW